MNEIIDKAIEELSEQQGRYVTEEEAARIEAAMKMLNHMHKKADAKNRLKDTGPDFNKTWGKGFDEGYDQGFNDAILEATCSRLNFDRAWDEAHLVDQFYERGKNVGYSSGYHKGYDEGVADTLIKL